MHINYNFSCSVKNAYSYDRYNRLVQAQGDYVGPNDETPKLLRQEYSLEMKYDNAHNITTKHQIHHQGPVPSLSGDFITSQPVNATSYELRYKDYAEGSYNTDGYSYAQPHAPRKITQEPTADQGTAATLKQKKTIDYDANGNMTAIKQNIENPDNPLADEEMTLRRYRWDEEDRLRAVDLLPDNGPKRPEVANYTYDADGQRVVRYVPGRVEAVYSAHQAGDKDRLESFIYPSGLLTVKTLSLKDVQGPNDLGRAEVSTYTKHYYIGDQRVTSALGTADNLGALCGDIFMNINDLDTQAMMQLMDQKTQTAAQALNEDYTAFDKVLSLPQPLLYNGTLPSCKRYHTPDNYRAYWFHPDHLGSSSYISNLSGTISQHMEYFPFGESLVEEHKNSNNSPYKFNGKELDDETGNYYYGARYYNPKTSIWLSVDPLAEEYPGWSPYNYTLLNPVRLIDPDGRAAMPPDDYKINDQGEITRIRKTEDDFDVLYNSDISSGIQIDKGILGERVKTDFRTIKDDKKVCQPIQLLDISNTTEEKGKALFEFAAQNSDNEFSLQEFESGKKIIGTSFEKDMELSGGFTIKRHGKWSKHTHSHPNEWDPSPSPGDIKTVGRLKNKRGFNTIFNVYSPLSGKYKEYDENSTNELKPILIEIKK